MSSGFHFAATNLAPDPALRLALEAQCRELTVVLGRLESARANLVPGPANFWRGAARQTYDAGIDAIRGTLEAGIAAVRSARDRSAAAIASLGMDW